MSEWPPCDWPHWARFVTLILTIPTIAVAFFFVIYLAITAANWIESRVGRIEIPNWTLAVLWGGGMLWLMWVVTECPK